MLASQVTDQSTVSRSRVPASPRFRELRVALVHDWLITLGGADRVLLALHDVFPQAPVFVAVHDLRGLPGPFRGLQVRGSWLQRIPGAARGHRLLVPLMPMAFGRVDLHGYQLVVSSSHACAKGVAVPAGGVHICYCHTPMRYAWELQDEYLRALPALARLPARLTLAWLRRWDRNSARRVDHFIANSRYVAQRIHRHYGRAATVIYPPVDTDFFTPSQSIPLTQSNRGDSYLVVSRLVPYKRVDVAVQAFSRLGRPLVIAGDGPERGRLQRMAGPNVRFVGELSDEALRGYYRQCRALVFPTEDDFGLVPVEAQACGRPVIAYGRGGVLESVLPGVTGVFFDEQTPDALMAGIRMAEAATFDAVAIRRHAEQFSRQRFVGQIAEFVADALEKKASRERGRAGVPESRITNHESL